MIKAVLFDLDGTVADSLDDLADGVNLILKEHGYPVHPTTAYKTFVGNGIAKMIERALPNGAKTADNILNLKNEFLVWYADHYCDKTRGYPGIKEVLTALKDKGIKTAVITNKAQIIADKVVEKLFGDLFCRVYGQRENFPIKPDPALPNLAMSELGVLPEECVFVGDSNVDMQTGVNCGAYPVGVLWGFRSESELVSAGAAKTVLSPYEILKIIDRS